MQVGEKQRYVFLVYPYLTSLVQKGQTRGKKQAEQQEDAKKSQVQQSRSQLTSKEGMKAAIESERQDLSLSQSWPCRARLKLPSHVQGSRMLPRILQVFIYFQITSKTSNNHTHQNQHSGRVKYKMMPPVVLCHLQ